MNAINEQPGYTPAEYAILELVQGQRVQNFSAEEFDRRWELVAAANPSLGDHLQHVGANLKAPRYRPARDFSPFLNGFKVDDDAAYILDCVLTRDLPTWKISDKKIAEEAAKIRQELLAELSGGPEEVLTGLKLIRIMLGGAFEELEESSTTHPITIV